MKRDMWAKAVAFHGHATLDLAIGARMAEIVEKRFAKAVEERKLVCVSEFHGCSVDAIQSILGCTMGRGTLLYAADGKRSMSMDFYDRITGESLRLETIYLTDIVPPEQAKDMSELDIVKLVLSWPEEKVFYFKKPAGPCPEIEDCVAAE